MGLILTKYLVFLCIFNMNISITKPRYWDRDMNNRERLGTGPSPQTFSAGWSWHWHNSYLAPSIQVSDFPIYLHIFCTFSLPFTTKRKVDKSDKNLMITFAVLEADKWNLTWVVRSCGLWLQTTNHQFSKSQNRQVIDSPITYSPSNKTTNHIFTKS